MSLIRALKDQRNPYTIEGRAQENLVDHLTQLEITNENLRRAFEELMKDLTRAGKNLETQRLRVLPLNLLESVTEMARLSEERAQTIDFIIDLCYTLGIDSVDLLDELWQQGENK